MKKLIAFLLLATLTGTTYSQGLDLGIKAGVNFSNITDADGLSSRTGFIAGGFVGVKLGDKLGIQGEVLYSQQGADFDLGKFNLDYVNIPLLLKLYVTERIHIHGGPQFGVLVNDETQSNVGEVINDIATNDTDFSGIVGLGVDIPFGLRIDGRYNFGLSDVPDEPGFNKGKNSVVTLSIGYSFF